MGRIALGVAPTEPSTVYALIARSDDFKLNGLFRSLDGGETWSHLASLPLDLFTEDGLGQGLFNLLVEVDPRDAAVLYAGGVNLWKSTDFGSSWENLSTVANLHEDPREIVFDPGDPQTFYMIGDSGVWRSSDGGRSFANLNQSLAITQFQAVGLHPFNPSLAVGGTQDNGTALYRGGSLWEQGRPGDSGAAFYDPFNPQTVYTVANRFSLRRSDDGGSTFGLIAPGLSLSDRVLFYPPFVHHPTDPGVLYFGTQRLWESRDRGDHWEALSGDLTSGARATISVLTASPISPQTLYAGTTDGAAQISQDGGRSWFRYVNPSLPNRYITSIAADPRGTERMVVGVSGFGTGHVFRTADYGANWEDISRNLPDIPVNAVLLDAASPDTIYIGTDIGVFVLLPDGLWKPLQDGMPNTIVLGLAQNASTGLLVAATHGRGAFAIAAGGLASVAPRLEQLANAAGGLPMLPLAPGMIASLFGANLAASTSAVTGPPPLPPTLAGTTLFINGVPAPLFYVSPAQVNFQVPYGVTGASVEILLRTQAGEAAMRFARADGSPGIFQNGGVGSIIHANGTQVSQAAPAQRGEELVLFASGLGEVQPPVASGTAAPSSPSAGTVIAPTVRVAGATAEVRFSGLAPGFVGLYQVNFVVPPDASGTVPVSLEIGGITSNSVSMSVVP
jgi:uncharacterized protein (TIGR03437 family)